MIDWSIEFLNISDYPFNDGFTYSLEVCLFELAVSQQRITHIY